MCFCDIDAIVRSDLRSFGCKNRLGIGLHYISFLKLGFLSGYLQAAGYLIWRNITVPQDNAYMRWGKIFERPGVVHKSSINKRSLQEARSKFVSWRLKLPVLPLLSSRGKHMSTLFLLDRLPSRLCACVCVCMCVCVYVCYSECACTCVAAHVRVRVLQGMCVYVCYRECVKSSNL